MVVEPCFEPGGDDGRLGATEEKPDMFAEASGGGDPGFDWVTESNKLFMAGVEALRGIFWRLSFAVLNDCERGKLDVSQSRLELT